MAGAAASQSHRLASKTMVNVPKAERVAVFKRCDPPPSPAPARLEPRDAL